MPIILKRYYKIILAQIVVLAILVFGLGNKQIIAYSSSKQLEPIIQAKNYENKVDLFDDDVVHEIKIIAAYNTKKLMITGYQISGNKDVFAADILIDGVKLENIGIRLKGNASLRSVANANDFFAGPAFFPPALREVPTHCWDYSPFPAPPGLVKKDTSDEHVPFLIIFDAFVQGQTYQGYSEFAIRTSGVEFDAAQLHEPLTNLALQRAGLPASDVAYASFQFNDDPAQLYGIAEVLNQEYINKHFSNNKGTLYKVIKVGNDFAYLGDDLSKYAEIFEQKTSKNQSDLTPLTKFMKFVSEATDAEFEKELGNWLDIDSFANYLAVENLLVNFDSLAGMGNNYYLYYDDVLDKFTVLAWDANESLGKLGQANFDLFWNDRFSPPGVGGPPPGANRNLEAEMPTECAEAFAIFEEKLGPPPDTQGGPPNQGPPPPPGANMPPTQEGEMGPFGDGKHVLKDRLLGSDKLKTIYISKLRDTYKLIFESDLLEPKAVHYQELLTTYNQQNQLFKQEDFDKAVDTTLGFIAQRKAYLRKQIVLFSDY